MDELCQWRGNRAELGECIVKNAYLDLGIAVSNKLTEIFKVKTSTARQVLYTAIGQILVHDAAGTAKCFLVTPNDGSIPHDVDQALKRFQIKALRFELTNIAAHSESKQIKSDRR